MSEAKTERVYQGAIPSQSPSVTALPEGEPRSVSCYIACWNGNGSGKSPGAVLSYSRNLHAESLHLPAQLFCVAVEDDARHTGALRAFDVLGGVVDKQTFPGNKTERLVQSIVDFRSEERRVGKECRL